MSDKSIDKTIDKTMDRRKFLKLGSLLGVGTALSIAPSLHTSTEQTEEQSMPIWRMIINASLCADGCSDCVSACHTENNVHEDLRWIRKATIVKEHGGKSVSVNAPILCNQCDNPPCALVCPVEATFQRPDKIVDVDKHRCIGCRYCVIGCPYDVRVFNFTENHKTIASDDVNPIYPKRMHGVAESCNFCAHRIDRATEQGKEPVPACVESCTYGAMVFGDINKPDSKISKYIKKLSTDSIQVKGLREDLGTKPKVLYLGF